MKKDIVDLCCGPRSCYGNAADPHTIYGDRRIDEIVVTDRSHGKLDGKRTIRISPEVVFDFRALPLPSESMRVAIFDPPHFVRAGKTSYMAAKYGLLSSDWRNDLRLGFAEAFRVLEPRGTLIFKWNDSHVCLSEILPLAGQDYLVCQKREKTHWIVFVKEGKATVS